MIEKLNDRYNQIILFCAIFIGILLVRLFSLSIVEGDKYKKMADEIRIKKIPISAPRGEIRDRYGRLLSGNKPSFTVQIMKNELIDEKINEVAVRILDILINNGEKYVDNFPIIYQVSGFKYSYDTEVEEWLAEQGINNVKTAEDAFTLLRERLEIDPSLDVYEAQLEMQRDHGIYPPISVKTMKFIPQMQKENFLKRFNLDTQLTAEEAFYSLREQYKIPDSYSDEGARKILVIRNELKEQGYRQYQPVKIALNVSPKTVAAIEEMGMELPGINVEVDPIRYYPYDNLGSHIIGYLGKISDSEKEKYINELGYAPNDLIGIDGIERKYESDLKGKDGAKYVEVDVYGRLVNVLREEKPVKGETVYLSIDANLQKVAEEALEQALQQIQVGGAFQSQWGNYKYGEAFPNATSGAVVALDVNTAEVLAMASYPSFNPNLFATGISSADWKALQDTNPRDPLSPIPLYNASTKAAVQPGSTFKMITGLAAIEQGLDPEYKMYDDGYILLGGRSFGCWLWNDKKLKHGWVDLYRALEVSCNYYFYNVSTGWDHFKNQSLGIGMNVDKLLDYAKIFGLNEPAGIEISESIYGVPNPSKKLEGIKSLLKRNLKSSAKEYFDDEIIKDQDELEKEIDQIVGWTEENPSRGTLINRVREMHVKQDKVEPLVDLVKFNYFNQANWSKGDTFNLAIGQGEHAYTPLQMARYISTLANGGYSNKVTVIKKVGNDNPPENNEEIRGERIPLNDYKNLDVIKVAMRKVSQGEEGTGRTVFKTFPVEVMAKTGTAQKSGKIQPKDEAAYLRKYLKWIAPNISLAQVEEKAKDIMAKNKDIYKDEGLAMRKAIQDLSNGKITEAVIDQFKDSYDNFGWFVSYAPFDNPQIAIVAMVYQGGHGGYVAPVAREIFAEYLGLNKQYEKVNFKNTLTH